MFGSSIIDVLIGTILVFLAVSLVTSAATEAISALLALRQTTLRSGIQKLLNDPNFTGLARDVYNHALVSPFGDGMAKTVADLTKPPAYINGQQFATALYDILFHAAPPATPLDITAATIPNEQLRRAMQALLQRATQTGTTLEHEIGDWFDKSMNRVSGWYKRYTQWISFGVAVLLAAALNADTIHVVESLWQHPAMAAALANGPLAQQAASPAAAQTYLDTLEATNSLVGWHGWGQDPRATHWGLAALMVIGWVVTASATLYGASFWFDLLQRLVQVRATGKAEGARPAGR